MPPERVEAVRRRPLRVKNDICAPAPPQGRRMVTEKRKVQGRSGPGFQALVTDGIFGRLMLRCRRLRKKNGPQHGDGRTGHRPVNEGRTSMFCSTYLRGPVTAA